MQTAQLLVWLLTIYGGIGALVAALFLFIGIDRIDEDARGSYAFRPLLIPGVIVLWPVVIARWIELEGGR